MSDSLRDQLQSSLGTAYTIERELGGGGMSRVFVARDEALERDVVIKVLSPELAHGLSADRFAREIKLAAALQEPHIVPLHAAAVTAEGLPYYTMPYVRGESLRERMLRAPVPLPESVAILRDVARALAYAHRQGIVHRDIKPENVLLNEETAVVTDFGIAKALSAAKTQAPGGTLTQLGTSLGTPAYMAPEQGAGDDVDHRADIYAWGVMAYELLAGRHPFADRIGAQQLIAAHIAEQPAPLNTTGREVPAALAALVMRSLAKDPAARPGDARELVSALSQSQTAERPAAMRHPAARFGAIAAVLAVLATVAVLSSRRFAPRAAEAATIAVLPFESVGAPEQAFFAEGLADAVTVKLVGVTGLTVIDRRSSSTYKGTTKTAVQIGAELGVAYLLEGVVRWARDAQGGWRAQVSSRLVRTRDGTIHWGGQPMIVTPTDPFSAQAEIATQVVAAIGVALAPREEVALREAPTKNPRAYELYLRGMALLRANQSGPAVDSLRLATEADPTFALAFAALAGAISTNGFSDTSAVRGFEQALAAALRIDPELPEAHFERGTHLWFHESRFVEALAAVARASAAKPGDAEMLSMLGTIQIVSGQTSEGFANVERTTVLDPRDFPSNANAMYFSWQFRRFDDAERHARRAMAIEPSGTFGPTMLAKSAMARGDTAAMRRAIADAQRAGAKLGGGEWIWILPPEFASTFAEDSGFTTQGDRLSRLVILGTWHRERGESARARSYYDSALVTAREAQYATSPQAIRQVPWLALQAIALAGTDRPGEARRALASADSITRLNALPNEPVAAIGQDYAAYALLALGDRDAALARLERVLALPSGRTKAMLRMMWPYASLRGDAGFGRLVGE